MSDSELAIVSLDSFSAPALITRAAPSTRKKFFDFFTVPIRNANTRTAYYRAIQQFLAWADRAGYQDLEDIEPITVATLIENRPNTSGLDHINENSTVFFRALRASTTAPTATLVGADMLSVLLFPTFAGVLLSRIARTAPTAMT